MEQPYAMRSYTDADFTQIAAVIADKRIYRPAITDILRKRAGRRGGKQEKEDRGRRRTYHAA